MILEQLSSSETEEQDINTYCYPDKIVTRVVCQCSVSSVQGVHSMQCPP